MGTSMVPGGSCAVEGMQQGVWVGNEIGCPVGSAWAVWHHVTIHAPFCCLPRVVSDHCYPFSGREQAEAGPAPPCMMHSRAMGRGKRQATRRCPNSHTDANDIYQVTPAYRLGSDVSLHMGKGQKQKVEGLVKGWSPPLNGCPPVHPLPQEKEIMKELMENGPVQGKCCLS